VCIATNQPDTESNPNSNPNPNHNHTAKQHAVVNFQLNIQVYSRMSYVSREIHTRQCCGTVCTNFGCYCHTGVHKLHNRSLSKLVIDCPRYHMEQFNIWNSLPNYVITAESVNSFKSRLDKFWKHQELMYNYGSELHGTGSRSEFNW